jgi:cytochrome P450
MLIALLDLFLAGVETTSTTLSWTFLILANHPEVQEKLYEEIKEKIGASSLPKLADKAE